MSYSPRVTPCAGPTDPLIPPLQAPLGKGCSQSERVARGEIGTCPREEMAGRRVTPVRPAESSPRRSPEPEIPISRRGGSSARGDTHSLATFSAATGSSGDKGANAPSGRAPAVRSCPGGAERGVLTARSSMSIVTASSASTCTEESAWTVTEPLLTAKAGQWGRVRQGCVTSRTQRGCPRLPRPEQNLDTLPNVSRVLQERVSSQRRSCSRGSGAEPSEPDPEPGLTVSPILQGRSRPHSAAPGKEEPAGGHQGTP